MLRTKVILLNVTNLSDARYAAGMGVDFIGFSINPVSNNYVTSEDVKIIIKWLSGVSLVGDIGKSIPAHIDYKVDYFLTDQPALLPELDEPILLIELTPENKLSVRETLANLNTKVSFYILKIKEADLAKLLPELQELNATYDCFLSTEFTEENLEELLEAKPKGIVLYGSHEEKPGLSNYDGIADVLELLDEV